MKIRIENIYGIKIHVLGFRQTSRIIITISIVSVKFTDISGVFR